jgi:hypothetical protein
MFNNLDLNCRKIEINIYENVSFLDKNLNYPNVKFVSHSNINNIINPINEEIQSLKNKNISISNLDYNLKLEYKQYTQPLFFMIYNFDNYYHYLYDTLPYLISYFKLKKKISNLKLLCNFPKVDKKEFYPFNLEFLSLLGITTDELIIVDLNTKYSNIWVSDSYTHGGFSNHRPNSEIFDFYNKIKNLALEQECNLLNYKNIYISRRSHLHKNYSNIGTNYTQRRKLVNEDILVEKLKELKYQEIFTENLNTIQKIHLFHNAKNIIGCIGGGIANVLFSPSTTNLYAIISPYFLDINYRFKYCLECVNVKYIIDTYHIEPLNFKKYMRVQEKKTDLVGEIININGQEIEIQYKNGSLSGWNHEEKFLKKYIQKENCIRLDRGLNSSFVLNIDKLLVNLKIKKALVTFNQGWTDIILCIGLIFYYCNTYDQILLLIREDSKELINFIFRYYPKVKPLYYKQSDLDNIDFRLQIFKQYESEYDLLLHGSYGYNKGYYQDLKFVNKKGTTEHFYQDYGIDKDLSYKYFNIDRNYKLEDKIYEEFIQDIKLDYIVVFNDVNRNFEINDKYLPNLPRYNLNQCSKICFDVIKILERAKEIHIFSSFWALIIYNLQKRYDLFNQNNIYFHNYVRPNYYLELYTNNSWNFIDNYKTAVCLVGGLRNETYQNFDTDKIIQNLDRCYNLSDSNTDIFIFNNCDSVINQKLKEYFGDRIKFMDSYQNKKNFYDQEINQIKLKLNSNYEHSISNFNDWLLKNSNNLNNFTSHVPFKNKDWKIPKFRSYHQYYHLIKALEKVIEYENNNNFKYEFIMKIRIDFFLKENNFSPNHYFNDCNNILLKNYDNMNKLYQLIQEEDEYDNRELRINNYLYYRTPKFLGGQYIKNTDSYTEIQNLLKNRYKFNKKIKSNFFILVNDACFFSNRNNFIKIIHSLFQNFGSFYDSKVPFWWTAEAQLQLCILKNKCFYLDYLQNNNYYYGVNMWFDSFHGCERYN